MTNAVNTGEGIINSGDGIPDGIISLTTGTESIAGVNFGIEQLPTAVDAALASQQNPGGTNTAPVYYFYYSGTDPDGGVGQYHFTTFPANTNTITINGSTYTAATWPAAGVTTPNIYPTIDLDPADGSITSLIYFKAIDIAGKESPNTATISVPFTDLTLSGVVYNDPTGLSNYAIDGTATNVISTNTLYANLVNTATGMVTGSVPVNSNGTYSFSTANGLAANTGYTVVLNKTAGTAGQPVPATALSGAVNTSEGNNTYTDGTVDGNVAVNMGTTSITNVNFGVDILPVPQAPATLASVADAGGTASVAIPPANFNGTDADGTVTQVRFTALPAGATSITVNGTVYDATNFPVAGVTVNKAGLTVSVDPIGSGTVTIPYAVLDNAGMESLTTSAVSQPFTGITLSGTVYDDANALTDNLVNGVGKNVIATNTLYANLVNTGSVVAGVVPVASDGTYMFTTASGLTQSTTFTVQITATPGSVGAYVPATTLTGAVNTGEGTAAAGDGTPDGITSIAVGTTNITGVNFGIDVLPVPVSSAIPSQTNPGSTVAITIPTTSFTGTDGDGTADSVHYTTFPTFTTSITIGSTTYTAGTWPAAGVIVPAGTSYALDPQDGLVTPVIPFKVIDNAGKESSTAGSVSVPLVGLAISGTVYNDANGLTDGLVNGIGTYYVNQYVYVSLIDATTNKVLAYKLANADGTYIFTSTDGIIANTSYSVLISNTASGAGSNPPAITFSTVVTTGEGANAAGDGTPNGITAVTLANTSVSGVNFGLDILPLSVAANLTAQVNPGGSASVPVDSTKFSGTDADGTVKQIHYTTFPDNTTSVTIGTTTYTAATWPPTGITVPVNTSYSLDPVGGAVTVLIPFKVIDNAGKESTAGSTVTMYFTDFQLNGYVYDDYNGMTDNAINATNTNLIGTNLMYVSLVDAATNIVIGIMPAATSGYYSFNTTNGLVANTNLKVVVSNVPGVIGSNAPSTMLTGAVNTGEGLVSTGDGTPDGIIPVSVGTATINNVSFGIDMLPVPVDGVMASQQNPGGYTTINVPAAKFTGTDFEDATTMTGIHYTGFPTNITSVKIGTTIYTAATWPAAGITVPAATTVDIDPVDGAVSAVIPFKVLDRAGKESVTAANVTVPFTDLAISGIIYNDGNGQTDNAINGKPVNVIGSNTMYANLVSANGIVLASTPVGAGGAYSFGTADGVTSNSTYKVVVTNTAGTPGSASPTTAMTNAVNTAEGQTTTDGTVDGSVTVAIAAINISNVNFGIDLLPVPSDSLIASQKNPGLTNMSTIPYSVFKGTDADGTATQIHYTGFPSNTTSAVINGTSYTAATFPAAGITTAIGKPVSIDPTDGAVSVVIPFRLLDNAGMESTVTGMVTMPFTDGISATPLPLTLMDFEAQLIADGKVQLNWTSVNEQKLEKYVVVRSTDGGKTFSDLGSVAATGNGAAAHGYHFTDEHPQTGNNYYKLRMQAVDGSYSYSATRMIRIAAVEAVRISLSVWPNPVVSNSTLRLKFSDVAKAQLVVVDAAGHVVMQSEIHQSNSYEISTAGWKSGQYYIRIAVDGDPELLSAKVLVIE